MRSTCSAKCGSTSNSGAVFHSMLIASTG
jgi:hypothetical protein